MRSLRLFLPNNLTGGILTRSNNFEIAASISRRWNSRRINRRRKCLVLRKLTTPTLIVDQPLETLHRQIYSLKN